MTTFNNLNVIEKAKIISEIAHFGQKYGNHDYTFHLDEVAEELKQYNAPDYIIAAGYLHDVLEDTIIKPKFLLKYFDTSVVEIVLAVTNSIELSNKNKLVATYTKLYQNQDAIFVKLADRICNVSFSIATKNSKMMNKYTDQHPFFKEMLYDDKNHLSMWKKLDILINAIKYNTESI